MEIELGSRREIRGEGGTGTGPPTETAAQARVLDKLGQEILPGGYICYAVQDGGYAGMKIGKVIRVESTIQISSFRSEKKCLGQCVIVRGVDEWWNPPRLNKKNGTLTETGRIVVIPESRVPEKYLGLLRGVE